MALAITPGLGIAYVVARTVAEGRSEGLASCLGSGLDALVHVLAAAFGLSLLIAQSAWAFSLVKYVGAAYLVYLGVRTLARRNPGGEPLEVDAKGARRAFTEGIVVEALNIKTALFFLAFLARFNAEVYGRLHGPVDAVTLIPHMLAAFIARDRGFKVMRGKSTKSAGSV